MTRKLLIVFASGLFFAIVLLSSAWVLGGTEMVSRIKKDGGSYNISFDDDKPTGSRISRSFPFEDIETLTISAPVSLKFVKADKVEMTVSGPEKLMNALIWENGELSLKGRSSTRRGRLEVTITAPVLPPLVMKGASNADLAGLDQPRLSIDAAGALELDGEGKVEAIDIDAKGASDIDLRDVEARDARVRIAGAGDIDINASGKVDATISGAGDISLHRKPDQLTSQINGAGSIDHDY